MYKQTVDKLEIARLAKTVTSRNCVVLGSVYNQEVHVYPETGDSTPGENSDSAPLSLTSVAKNYNIQVLVCHHI